MKSPPEPWRAPRSFFRDFQTRLISPWSSSPETQEKQIFVFSSRYPSLSLTPPGPFKSGFLFITFLTKSKYFKGPIRPEYEHFHTPERLSTNSPHPRFTSAAEDQHLPLGLLALFFTRRFPLPWKSAQRRTSPGRSTYFLLTPSSQRRGREKKMFARKDIERDALSDYRQYGRQARTHKDLPGGAPSASSEWPRVFVPAEPVEPATPEPTPARAPPVEKIVLRGVSPAGPSSKTQTHWASHSAGQSFLFFIFLLLIPLV